VSGDKRPDDDMKRTRAVQPLAGLAVAVFRAPRRAGKFKGKLAAEAGLLVLCREFVARPAVRRLVEKVLLAVAAVLACVSEPSRGCKTSACFGRNRAVPAPVRVFLLGLRRGGALGHLGGETATGLTATEGP
jgi:hypothetical protein